MSTSSKSEEPTEERQPVCIVEVDLTCCDKCPTMLENSLMKIHVEVDPEKSILTVKGDVDPVKLVHKIRKMGKSTAKMLYYKSHPKNLEGKKKKHEEKEGKQEDVHLKLENDHYAKRPFKDHEPVHFSKPPTEFLDHMCGDVRTGVHFRHPIAPRGYGPMSHGGFFDPGYPIRRPHYPVRYM